MKTKQLSLMLVSLMALVLAMGMASSISVSGGSEDFTREGQTETIMVSEDNGNNFNVTDYSNAFNSSGVKFNVTSPSNKNNVNKTPFNVTLESIGNEIDFAESISATNVVNATNSTNRSDWDTTKINANYENSFCSNGESNESNVDFIVEGIENLDEDRGNDRDTDEWKPLDTIEVEVDFENEKNDNVDANDLEDIIIEMGLYEQGTNNNIADDLIWLSEDDEQFDAGDVDAEEDLEDTHTFRFQVDPSEIDESGDYYITVKSYEDNNEENFCVDEADYDDLGGNSEIKSDKIDIDLVDDWEEMFVVDTSSVEEPLEAACGSRVSMDLEVWNIGTEDAVEDFEEDYEDRMEVEVFSESLNVERNLTIRDVFDQGDSESFSMSFEVPKGIEKGEFNGHDVGLSLLFGYEEITDTYNDYEETYSQAVTDIVATGKCSIPKASIPSASLNPESAPKSGGSFSMTTRIQNTGENEESYSVGLSRQSTWVSSYQTNRDIFTIPSGESRQVEFSINVREGVSGNKSFDVQVSSDGEVVSERPVKVSVQQDDKEESEGINFDSFDSRSLVTILLVLIAAAIIAIAIALIVRSTNKKSKKSSASDF